VCMCVYLCSNTDALIGLLIGSLVDAFCWLLLVNGLYTIELFTYQPGIQLCSTFLNDISIVIHRNTLLLGKSLKAQ
jgi:hypothetical protein